MPRDAITRSENATGRNKGAVGGPRTIAATAISYLDAYLGERRWLGAVAAG